MNDEKMFAGQGMELIDPFGFRYGLGIVGHSIDRYIRGLEEDVDYFVSEHIFNDDEDFEITVYHMPVVEGEKHFDAENSVDMTIRYRVMPDTEMIFGAGYAAIYVQEKLAEAHERFVTQYCFII